MGETIIPTHTLRDGTKLPAIGFGTYNLNGLTGANSIAQALQNGYRLLDTAFSYENEAAVGEGIRRSGIDRNEIIVTSKLPGRHYEPQNAITALQESLLRLRLDYIDLYLLHWPNPKQDLYVEAWKTLIEAKRFGLVKNIGVCNFLPEHLERLQNETDELPVVNQVELHPYFSQAAQRKWNEEHDILTEAWSPLSRTKTVTNDKTLKQLAKDRNRSVAQIILRWHYQLGVLPIPKSASDKRQKENLAIFDFELTSEEMETIAKLTQPDGRIKNQDPAVYEEF